MASKKMIAIKKGYNGKKVIQKGETFDWEGKKGSWMTEYKPESKTTKVKSVDKRPANDEVI